MFIAAIQFCAALHGEPDYSRCIVATLNDREATREDCRAAIKAHVQRPEARQQALYSLNYKHGYRGDIQWQGRCFTPEEWAKAYQDAEAHPLPTQRDPAL